MRAGLATAALLALAACQTDVTGPVTASAPAAIPVSANAGPGPRNATVALGADIVERACLAHRPSFAGTPAALAAFGGFVQNSRTTTYYHQRHNLSVKVTNERCSVVMGGQFDTVDPARIRARTSAPAAVLPRDVVHANGKSYVSFVVMGGV